MKEYLCLCGHGSYEHNKMNRKAWDRLHEQLNGYSDDPKNREEFWNKYLASRTDDEWACTQCDCKSLKMDNLKYLEELYEEKKR